MPATPSIDWSLVDQAAGAPSRKELALEAVSCLGAELAVCGFPVPPLTAGKLVMLAALDSPLLDPASRVSREDVCIALLPWLGGRDALPVVAQRLLTGDGGELEADKVSALLDEHGTDADVLAVYLKTQCSAACAGFEMIPSGDAGGDALPFVFDACWLAAYVAKLAPATGMTAEEVVWDLPLVYGGFLLAQLARMAGVKDVERKRDWSAVFRELERQAKENAGG